MPENAILVSDTYRDKIYALPRDITDDNTCPYDFIREDITYDGIHRYVPLKP